MEIDLAIVLSLWGATLSTALAAIKIYESWGGRFQIEISPIFRSSPELGNDISIKNLSSKPVLLEYFEVFSKQKGKERSIWSPEDSWLNVRIDSNDTKVYNFSESDFFSSKHSPIYIRLYFAGQKSITKNIL